MWSLQGWLDSADADERLRASTEAAMDADPGAFSPSARLYGQGIKGIFGTRARTAEAYNWGDATYGAASAGVGGAYDAATGFVSERGLGFANLAGGHLDNAASFAGSSADRAATGIGGFLQGMSSWDSPEAAFDATSGGMLDALGFVSETQWGALEGAGSALWGMGGYGAGTLSEGLSGAGSHLASGAGFAYDRAGEAALGVGGALLDATEWGRETGGAVGDVGADLLGRGIGSIGESLGELPTGVFGGPIMASPESRSLLEEWLPW